MRPPGCRFYTEDADALHDADGLVAERVLTHVSGMMIMIEVWRARGHTVCASLADKLAVNQWRDVLTPNYQVATLADGFVPNITEPSMSHRIPSAS